MQAGAAAAQSSDESDRRVADAEPGLAGDGRRVDAARKDRPRQVEAPPYQDLSCIQRQAEGHPRREEDEGCNGSELIARAAIQKLKKSEKQRHYYSAKKQLLYEAKEREGRGGEETGGGDGTATATVVTKRGRPRKTVKVVDDGDKENVDPGATMTDQKKMKLVGREEEAREGLRSR